MNLKARKNFRSSTAATQSLIKARLNEGFTVEDFKKVIDIKCSEWLGVITHNTSDRKRCSGQSLKAI